MKPYFAGKNSPATIFSFFWITFTAGCQSGRIAYPLFSDDGQVVAFEDGRYATVYVADARGVRAVGQGYPLLSGDGKLLLLITNKEGGSFSTNFHKGDIVTVYEMLTGGKYTTQLPQEMFGSNTDVFFQDGPLITFSVWSQTFLEANFAWNPQQGWHICKRPDGIVPQRFQEKRQREHSNLVVLGPDGWNARRTVWVRPDGTTLELVRQNDLPLQFLGAVFYTPFAIVIPYSFAPLTAGAHWSEFGKGLSWQEGDCTVAELRLSAETIPAHGNPPKTEYHLDDGPCCPAKD